jgi:hypothetical protein
MISRQSLGFAPSIRLSRILRSILKGMSEANGIDESTMVLLQALKRLDEEFADLQSKESVLQQTLVRLQIDEECLRQATTEEESIPRQKVTPKIQSEAMARLQQALLGSDSSSTDED